MSRWLDTHVLEPLRVLGWWFPAIMLGANLLALGLVLAWERWAA